MITILQTILEQLLNGYDIKIIGWKLFTIPSQGLYIEYETDETGTVNKLSLSTYYNYEKENEHEQRRKINTIRN